MYHANQITVDMVGCDLARKHLAFNRSYGVGVSLAGSSGGSVNTGGGLVGGGAFVGTSGCVGTGVEVGGILNVGVGDRTRVTGIDVNWLCVGNGAIVAGTNVNGVTLAGPDGVFVSGDVAVTTMLPGVAVGGTAVTATGRGVVPHNKNPRQ
jgi:hypothetical protein